jgi:peptidoglycan L-alanyl-D-glutamate endopeptidase CwlK
VSLGFELSRLIEELVPELQTLCRELQQECLREGFPIIVIHTYRSFEEQELLYAKGRTRPGLVVTNARAGDSWHNYRRAFDVCFIQGSRLMWDGPWMKVWSIARPLGLVWGGSWKTFQDRPHFEYHPGLTLEEAKSRSLLPLVEPV